MNIKKFNNKINLYKADKVLLLSVLIPLTAYADTVNDIDSSFLKELQQRDVVIQNLQKRIEQLEQIQSTKTANSTNESSNQSQVSPQKNSQSSLLSVDKDAAERALERTLTQSGALLLPSGYIELQPNFTYLRSEQTSPIIVSDGIDTNVQNISLRRSEYTSSLFARAGLPHDAQLEFNLPYRKIGQSVIGPLNITTINESKTSASALGDISIGLAKTLYKESGWLPDIIGRLTWTKGTGKYFANNITVGDGFDKWRAGISFMKRQDPLAFVGNLSYEISGKEENIQPGKRIDFSLGTVLAASPETSINVELNQVFTKSTRLAGVDVPGSDQVASTFSIGATSTINKYFALSITTGFGLTKNAPDYFINFSLPIRYGLFE